MAEEKNGKKKKDKEGGLAGLFSRLRSLARDPEPAQSPFSARPGQETDAETFSDAVQKSELGRGRRGLDALLALGDRFRDAGLLPETEGTGFKTRAKKKKEDDKSE